MLRRIRICCQELLDSNFTGDLYKMKFIIDYLFTLVGGAVSQALKLQTVVALSILQNTWKLYKLARWRSLNTNKTKFLCFVIVRVPHTFYKFSLLLQDKAYRGAVPLCSRSNEEQKCGFVENTHQAKSSRYFDHINIYRQFCFEQILLWPNKDVSNMRTTKQKG